VSDSVSDLHARRQERPGDALDSALLDRLHQRANAEQWGVTPARFATALVNSWRHASPGGASHPDPAYLSGLHLDDLALACACADGHDAAWEHFVREQRPHLYRAAAAIDPAGGARDLADSIYAELFGLREQEGQRQSLFRYFHGRSSLTTWLRAILAQRHVDRVRAERRHEPLPEDETPAAIAAPTVERDPSRARYLALMARVLAEVVALLVPRDRLRLACYYARNLTLAETGRLLNEHEATVSRQLARTRTAIRRDVERRLKDGHGLGDAEIAQCFASVVSDAGPLDLAMLIGDDEDGKKLALDRSKERGQG
jgi:RNA polymerase sigma-70 factor (ECF subfamily)